MYYVFNKFVNLDEFMDFFNIFLSLWFVKGDVGM